MLAARSRGVHLLTVLLAASVVAQISGASPMGTAFTYQGQLQQGGVPANGPCDFQFSLFDAASGGSQMGSTQTVGALAVTNGLFTVPLDFGGMFSGENRYLDMSVRCPAGSGSYASFPRQKLSRSPMRFTQRWRGALLPAALPGAV